MSCRCSNKPEGRLLLSAVWAIYLAVGNTAFADVNSFDGVHSGKRTLTKGSSEFCSKLEEMSVTIQDREIYVYR